MAVGREEGEMHTPVFESKVIAYQSRRTNQELVVFETFDWLDGSYSGKMARIWFDLAKGRWV